MPFVELVVEHLLVVELAEPVDAPSYLTVARLSGTYYNS